MNEAYVNSFVKQARAAGMPQQKIAALLDRAYEISSRGNVKSAADNHLDQLVTGLLGQAGLDKTASSVAYTNGILKEALDQGATPAQAMDCAKNALRKTSEDLTTMGKMASIVQNQDYASYAEGFIKAATTAGLSDADATRAFVNLFEREKRAHGHDGGDMFKHTGLPPGGDPSQGGPPGMDPGAGVPPGMDDGSAGGPPGGDPSQGGPGGPGGQIPPELLIQLLQMLAQEQQQQQGGQGGPPGMMPPPGGAPPGMPPGGAPPGGMPGGPQ